MDLFSVGRGIFGDSAHRCVVGEYTKLWEDFVIAVLSIISNGMTGAQHSKRNRIVPFLMAWLIVQH